MNVSSTTSNSVAADFTTVRNRFETSMNKLSSALDSGDVSAAKAALSSMKPKNAPVDAPKGSQDNPVAKAFNSISSALDRGDVSSAKETLSSLKSQMKNAPAGGPSGTPPSDSSESFGVSDKSLNLMA